MSECLTSSSTTGANGNASLSSSTTSDSSTLASSANVSMCCMSSSLSPECLANSEIPPSNQDFRLFPPLTSDIEEGCSELVTKVYTD